MLDQIIGSIITNIPYYSTELNDTNNITNVSVGINVVTIGLEDEIDAGLSVGNSFIITGALFKNEIISLTPITGGYIVETSVEHDQTFLEYIDSYISIKGFGGDWDNSFKISSVLSTTKFAIITDLSAPIGTGYVLEDRYNTINGVQTISVKDTNSIVFAYTTIFTDYDLTNAKIHYNFRVTSTYDEQSAIRHYEKKLNDLKTWAYVIYNNSAVSKDSNIDSDSIFEINKADDVSEYLIINFSVLVMKKALASLTSYPTQDALLAFRFPLLKCLLGLSLVHENYLNANRYSVVFTGDDPAIYAGAYYGHVFNFQTQLLISSNETIDNRANAALRHIDLSLFLQFDDYEEVKKEIKADFPN